VQYCRAVVGGRILHSLGGLPYVASTHLQGWLRRHATGTRFQVRRGGAAHRFFGSPGYGAPRHRARSRQAKFFVFATVSRRLVLFERAVIDGEQDDDARPTRVPRPEPECVVELRFHNGGRVVERGFLSGDGVEDDSDGPCMCWTYIVGMPITGDAARDLVAFESVDVRDLPTNDEFERDCVSLDEDEDAKQSSFYESHLDIGHANVTLVRNDGAALSLFSGPLRAHNDTLHKHMDPDFFDEWKMFQFYQSVRLNPRAKKTLGTENYSYDIKAYASLETSAGEVVLGGGRDDVTGAAAAAAAVPAAPLVYKPRRFTLKVRASIHSSYGDDYEENRGCQIDSIDAVHGLIDFAGDWR
jgi:hypothetical protein